jgi:hypothetical protein
LPPWSPMLGAPEAYFIIDTEVRIDGGTQL